MKELKRRQEAAEEAERQRLAEEQAAQEEAAATARQQEEERRRRAHPVPDTTDAPQDTQGMLSFYLFFIYLPCNCILAGQLRSQRHQIS